VRGSNYEMRNCYVFVGVLLAAGLALIGTAKAEGYPAATVRMIVAYPPGGSTDTTARLLAQALSEKMHGTFVIENRSGAGGVIGANAVAKSTPDGYTLLYAASPELALVTTTKKSVPYDPVKDFIPISLIGSVPFVLVANNNFPANNLQELIDYSKKHPGSVNFSSFGIGTSNHLTGEMLNLRAGIKMTHVAYRGSAPSLTDIMGGQVQVTLDAVTAVLPLIQAGQVKPLAVATPQRLKSLPAVPTFAESGLPGFTGGTWFALMAPSGTPPSIVAALSTATTALLSSPGFQKILEDQGVVVQPEAGEAFRQYLSSEIDKWRKLAPQIGLEPQ
jgi:tripartite-type tricarboxylate transporter receptor subunit TctC